MMTMMRTTTMMMNRNFNNNTNNNYYYYNYLFSSNNNNKIRRIIGPSSSSSNSSHSSSRKNIVVEKASIVIILTIVVWCWIGITVGLVFFHGYHRKNPYYMRRYDEYYYEQQPHHSVMEQIQEQQQQEESIRSDKVRKRRKQQQQEKEEQQQEQLSSSSSSSFSSSSSSSSWSYLQPYQSPLLIFTCNRGEYLRETLNDIFKYIPRQRRHNNHNQQHDDNKNDNNEVVGKVVDKQDNNNNINGKQNQEKQQQEQRFSCLIGCPIIISQDGHNPEVTAVIIEYTQLFQNIGIPLVHLTHESSLRQGSKQRGSRSTNAYQALAVHYGWALQQVFDGNAIPSHLLLLHKTQEQQNTTTTTTTTTTTSTTNTGGAESSSNSSSSSSSSSSNSLYLPQRVIILEEDIHISIDFFDYFAALAMVLDHDNTILAISAFNDNGYNERVQDPYRLLRSDFFPGLGWMMNRQLWMFELHNKWPTGYWDDWLREPKQRMGRHIIRPEISRTYHFGIKGGASYNQFGQHLTQIQLNTIPVQWMNDQNENNNNDQNENNNDQQQHQKDLLSILNKDTYDKQYYHMVVDQSVLVHTVQEAIEHVQTTITTTTSTITTTKKPNARIEYNDFHHFQRLAKQFDIMDDEKAGIPRTSYHGIIETRPPQRKKQQQQQQDTMAQSQSTIGIGNNNNNSGIIFLTPPLEQLQKEFEQGTSKTTISTTTSRHNMNNHGGITPPVEYK